MNFLNTPENLNINCESCCCLMWASGSRRGKIVSLKLIGTCHFWQHRHLPNCKYLSLGFAFNYPQWEHFLLPPPGLHTPLMFPCLLCKYKYLLIPHLMLSVNLMLRPQWEVKCFVCCPRGFCICEMIFTVHL